MRSISRATGLLVLAYVLLPSPSFAATPTTLYTFGPAPDGWDPEGPLAIGKNGTLYRTTEYGGAYGYEGSTLGIGYGTVFSLAPPGPSGGAWTKTTIWNFGGTSTDGVYPVGGLVIGPGGTIYGVTSAGGRGPGTVFSLTPPATAGAAWTEAVLYNIGTASGDGYYGSDLIMGAGGVLYGTTSGGGPYGAYCGFAGLSVPCGGTVFSLSPPTSKSRILGGERTVEFRRIPGRRHRPE